MNSVSSVSVPTAASMSAQVSARLNRQAGETSVQMAGQVKDAPALKQKDRTDLVAELKAIEVQIAQRTQQARDVNMLDISYSKQAAMLSVKVKEEQTGDLVRELKYKDYKAMAYSSHGYKGAYVDINA
jgi:uncharacterized FlaG/YvyC family protein